MYELALISATACVCSFVYEHGASVRECVYGCVSGTRVGVTVTAAHSRSAEMTGMSTDTFKEGSRVSNSVPSGLCAKCFIQRVPFSTTSCPMFNV